MNNYQTSTGAVCSTNQFLNSQIQSQALKQLQEDSCTKNEFDAVISSSSGAYLIEDESEGSGEEDPDLLSPSLCMEYWVRYYMDQHLAVFPVQPLSKKPAYKRWQSTLQNSDLPKKFFYKSNIGIMTGEASDRIIVVDWDCIDKNDEIIVDVENAFFEWAEENPARLETPHVKTRRGYHFYFKVHPEYQLPKTNTKFCFREIISGDVKSTGGYVVAPPSVHESGYKYTWLISPKDVNFKEITTLADLGLTVSNGNHATEKKIISHETERTDEENDKKNIISVYDKKAYIEKAVGNQISVLKGSKEGNRNNTLVRSAFTLGMLTDDETIKQKLFDAALAIGLDDKEAWKTIASGWEAGRENKKDFKEIEKTINEKNWEEIQNKKNEKIMEALNENFDFRYNVITSLYNYRKKNVRDWRELKDRDNNSIWTFLSRKYFKSLSEIDLTRIIESDFTPEYDQIKEYINSLPDWDKKTDYIEQLASLVKPVPGQEKKWAIYFTKWLVACLATMSGENVNQTCLILIGPQNIGKSSFLKRLGVIPELTYSGSIDPKDKDSKILAGDKILIILDELESSQRDDWSFIKYLISVPEICARRPYGRRREIIPKRASFAGSVNQIQILGDLTGSRRWLCTEVVSIDFNSVTQGLMQNVYSQCLFLLNNNYKYWFDGNEIENINNNNSEYYYPCPEEDTLLDCFKRCDNEQGILLTTTEIMRCLVEKNGSVKYSIKKLGQVLHAKGFQREKRNPGDRYAWRVVSVRHDLM